MSDNTTLNLVEALRTFHAQHPERGRIEGAQSTAISSLNSAVEAIKEFNERSDVVFGQCAESLQKHVQLLGLLKRDLALLEDRVTRIKARAIRVAEHDGIDLKFLDEATT